MSVLKWCKESDLGITVAEDNHDEPDIPPNSYYVTWFDFVSLMYSIIFHLVDVAFDLYITYAYFTSGNYAYFGWTLAFILIPSIIMALVSIRMYVEDSKDSFRTKHAIVRIVLCVVGIVSQSAPLIRYCDSLNYAIKSVRADSKSSRKEYFKKMLNEDSDVALLKIFECYLEAAPQLVLQITLLILSINQGYSEHLIRQLIMITLSFIAMGWCMANYNRCIRFDQMNKQNISALGTTVQLFWHLSFTVSRVLAISALATLYTFWTVIAVVTHWCAMTVWLAIANKTTFCGKNGIFEIFFSAAVGIIYIFNFLNLKEGPTRQSYLFFYSFCFVENLIAATVWGIQSTVFKIWIYYSLIIFPILCFILSVVLLLSYYRFLHPNQLKSGIKNCNENFLSKN